MATLIHKHHVVPKHIGGTNDPSNLIELTVEEHAEAHRILYEQYGRWQDKVAWLSLSGMIGNEEVLKEIQIINGRKFGKSNIGKTPWNKGLKIENYQTNLGNFKQGQPSWNKGLILSEEHKNNISKSQKGIPKSETLKLKFIGNTNAKGNKGKPWSEKRRNAYSISHNNVDTDYKYPKRG